MHQAFKVPPMRSRELARAELESRLRALLAYRPEHPEDVAGVARAIRDHRAALGLADERIVLAPPPAPKPPTSPKPKPAPKRAGAIHGAKPVEVDGRRWASLTLLARDLGVATWTVQRWRNDGELELRVRAALAGEKVTRRQRRAE